MWKSLVLWCVVGALGATFDWENEWFEGEQVDSAYIKHAKAHKDDITEESKKAGESFACGTCQMLAKVAEGLIKARQSEGNIHDLFQQTCKELPAPERLNAEDAKALCFRVVREHLSDMLDALSVGESIENVCRDVGLCTTSYTETMDAVKQYSEALEKAKKEREEEMSGTKKKKKKKKKKTKSDD